MIELLGGAKRVAIVTHRRADADALACAKVIQLVLERIGVTVAAVVCPEGSQLGGCSRESPSDVDLYVLADVASLSQVPPLRGRYFKIDHHHVGDEIPGIVVQRPSCTEIALKLAEEAGVELTPEVAKLAALGIYADTGRLKRADAETLRLLAKLLEKTGGTLGDLIREEERAEELQRVVALLKGMKRLEAYRSSFGVICTSHVGAYEADVASLLLSIGCSIALVASRKEDGVHVVMRSRGFDVATLAKSLGTGGGHKEAAVAIIRENVTKSQLPSLLRRIVKQIDPSAESLVQ
jgi:nanoRNase/pAp phosphatase (c-di-AMP/oligoRNAs hydrolase)